MCDTLVFRTDDGELFFAKNSDRPPDEPQVVEYNPPASRSKKIRMTYVDAEVSGEVIGNIISRPYWMWGAEMGFNQEGVSIGNEAIFTKRKFNDIGMTGMDLLRLGLEEARTSKRALEIMCGYVEN
ncbi:MAG: C69 family dipeptidase, partial [Thermoplasmata archaeon]